MAIEKAFGVLKRRFPALQSGTRLHDPVETCKLVHSAFLLHNICVLQQDRAVFEDNGEDENPAEINRAVEAGMSQNAIGARIRDDLCNYLR